MIPTDKNPASCDTEEEGMDLPQAEDFVPPVNVTANKFIELAGKMKELSEDTLNMIKKDLQPKDTAAVVKVESTDVTPAQLLT